MTMTPAAQTVNTIASLLVESLPSVSAGTISTGASGCGGVGSNTVRVLRGTMSHNPYAARAPAIPRKGVRSRPTRRAATLAAIVSSSRQSTKSVTIELLEEALEVREIPLRQLSLFAEVGYERGYAAAEQSVQEAFALRREPLLPRQQRRVLVAAAGFFGPRRALFDEAAQEGLDRRFRPVLLIS